MGFKKGNKLQKLGKGNYKGGKVEKECEFCGRKFKIFPCLNRIKYCSSKCFHNSTRRRTPWNKGLTSKTDKRVMAYSEKRCGSESHFWRGGKSFEEYPAKFNKIFKLKIKQRDSFTCQKCGTKEDELKWSLSIHHIDFDKNNINIKNLISLCRACHAETNYNRNKWINFYKKFMREIHG